MNIVISPRLPDPIYTVKTSATLDLTAVWTLRPGFTPPDSGCTQTIADTAARGPHKLFRV